MSWNVEYTDEFGAWWMTLDESEQDSVEEYVPIADKLYDDHLTLLEQEGLI
jgi:hypothetical protein